MSKESLTIADQVHFFIDNLEESLKYVPDVTFLDCKNILFCGMGGSAIAGDITSDYAYQNLDKFIYVLKFPILPSWSDCHTLAIISSYSGNTVETLQMYEQALAHECKIVVMTSGGILEQRARADNKQIIKLPKNLHPRQALGYLIGYAVSVISSVSSIDLRSAIKSAIPNLKTYRDLLEKEDAANPAIILAERLVNKIPIICADDDMKSVALRWKTQLNENSKIVAFCCSAQEVICDSLTDQHNRNLADNFILLTISHHQYDNTNTSVCELESLISAADVCNVSTQRIDFSGSSQIESILKAIMLGDHVSLHAARLKNVDPAEVKAIIELKELIQNRLNRTTG